MCNHPSLDDLSRKLPGDAAAAAAATPTTSSADV